MQSCIDLVIPYLHEREQFGDGTEHVQLDLVGGAVAEAHRPAAAVASQVGNDAFGAQVAAGDGVAMSDESKLELVGKGKAQVLLFDLK